MPVIFSLPSNFPTRDLAKVCASATADLAAAGWYCITPEEGGATLVARVKQAAALASESDLDILILGRGASIVAPSILAALNIHHGDEVPVDVMVAMADPLDLLVNHWVHSVEAGSIDPLDRVLDAICEHPETLSDLTPMATLAPLIAQKQVRLHTVAVAELNVPILHHLLTGILGVNPGAGIEEVNLQTPDDLANSAIAITDAKRLISTVLWRDGGMADAMSRAEFVSRISHSDILDLAALMREKARIARRDLRFTLPVGLANVWAPLGARLGQYWTTGNRDEVSLSRGTAQLAFFDVDAALSVGKIAGTAGRLAGFEPCRNFGSERAILVSEERTECSEKHEQFPSVEAEVTGSKKSPRSSDLISRQLACSVRTAEKTKGVRKLLALGHSHIGALDLAWKAGGAAHEEFLYTSVHLNSGEFQPNFEQARGGRRIAPGFRPALDALLTAHAPDLVVALPMGNEYNAVAMTPVGPPFEFFSPSEIADPALDICQIPYAMMRAQIATLAQRNALLILAEIADAADCPVIALPPPPPIFEEAHIRAFPGRFADALKENGLNPANVRARLWTLYCDVLAEALTPTAAELITLPDEVFEFHSGQRFLASEMRAQDPTHANAAYGACVLAEISAHVIPAKADAA